MISLNRLRQAAAQIQNWIVKTPLVHSPAISRMFGGEVYLKLENLQKTGSFKIRGASYKLLTCSADIGPGGVVAASAGNHAQGLALAAKQLDMPATIVMPEWVSITKKEATRMYGAKVVTFGQSIGECLEEAQRMTREGKMFIHPFDDEDIITGQGTTGLEIFDELARPDLVVVPVGGGGLISGIVSAAMNLSPETRLVGVQAASCPSAYEAFMTGRITQVEGRSSIADGISVKKVGQLTFDIIQEGVDEIVLADEEQIAAAILLLLEREKILAEGAGAAPLAALMNGSLKLPREGRTVLVISGGNVDSPLLGRIISQGLTLHGRVMRVGIRMADIPGSLSKLLALIAATKANVLHIYHDRNVRGTPIYVTHVDLELETRGPAHVKEITETLQSAGYEIRLP